MPTVWGRLSQATLKLAGAETSAWATSGALRTFQIAFIAATGTQATTISFPTCQIMLPSSLKKTEDRKACRSPHTHLENAASGAFSDAD